MAGTSTGMRWIKSLLWREGEEVRAAVGRPILSSSSIQKQIYYSSSLTAIAFIITISTIIVNNNIINVNPLHQIIHFVNKIEK